MSNDTRANSHVGNDHSTQDPYDAITELNWHSLVRVQSHCVTPEEFDNDYSLAIMERFQTAAGELDNAHTLITSTFRVSYDFLYAFGQYADKQDTKSDVDDSPEEPDVELPYLSRCMGNHARYRRRQNEFRARSRKISAGIGNVTSENGSISEGFIHRRSRKAEQAIEKMSDVLDRTCEIYGSELWNPVKECTNNAIQLLNKLENVIGETLEVYYSDFWYLAEWHTNRAKRILGKMHNFLGSATGFYNCEFCYLVGERTEWNELLLDEMNKLLDKSCEVYDNNFWYFVKKIANGTKQLLKEMNKLLDETVYSNKFGDQAKKRAKRTEQLLKTMNNLCDTIVYISKFLDVAKAQNKRAKQLLEEMNKVLSEAHEVYTYEFLDMAKEHTQKTEQLIEAMNTLIDETAEVFNGKFYELAEKINSAYKRFKQDKRNLFKLERESRQNIQRGKRFIKLARHYSIYCAGYDRYLKDVWAKKAAKAKNSEDTKVKENTSTGTKKSQAAKLHDTSTPFVLEYDKPSKKPAFMGHHCAKAHLPRSGNGAKHVTGIQLVECMGVIPTVVPERYRKASW